MTYKEGDVVWFVHSKKLEVFECVIQEYIDPYWYAFTEVDDNVTLMPIHQDNLCDDEHLAKKLLFKMKLTVEK